ncbi:chaplin family protein [Streptomyces sp. NPDC053086]|uniref:chaplin n=1 Tax=unclassified Streptomyces TaxID=2593676 RepID=UPI0037CF6665
MFAIAAASGAMAVAGPVYADSAASGSAAGSPGLISGNGIQLPVHVPVSACGNTANVAGLLNPAVGNRCANVSDTAAGQEASTAPGGATAEGSAQDSPGVVSGNGIQLPVDLPVNVSGNSVNVVGVGNPVIDNESVNTSDHPAEPGRTTPPVKQPPVSEPPTRVTPPVRHRPPAVRPTPKPSPVVVRQRATGTLAHTGPDNAWPAALASLASLMGGTVLYRRFRARPAGRDR